MRAQRCCTPASLFQSVPFQTVVAAIAAVILLATATPVAAEEPLAAEEPVAAEKSVAAEKPVATEESVAAEKPVSAEKTADVIVVVGAAGEPEYQSEFERWAGQWELTAQRAGASHTRIGTFEEPSSRDPVTDRERLIDAIQVTADDSTPLWIVLIGHGTFYRDVAKFNLVGPDISAAEFADLLEPIRRPLVFVNTASASGPFINRLSRQGRIVVTATKSGAEINYTRFGDYFSSAIGSDEADLDHDGEVSVLEAFLYASAEVRRFYQSEDRLSTEHALLDDNGDGLGTPSTLFRGLRVEGKVKDGAQPDGDLARRITLAPVGVALPMTESERQERDQIERAVESLRSRKTSLSEEEYYAELEPLLLSLGRLYQQVESRAEPEEELEESIDPASPASGEPNTAAAGESTSSTPGEPAASTPGEPDTSAVDLEDDDR